MELKKVGFNFYDTKETDKESLKYDEDKLRYDLIDVSFEEEIAKVLTAGAKKYGPNNWQNLKDAENRYYAALRRHLAEWRKGLDKDDDGINHLAAIACNAMFLYHICNRGE